MPVFGSSRKNKQSTTRTPPVSSEPENVVPDIVLGVVPVEDVKEMPMEVVPEEIQGDEMPMEVIPEEIPVDETPMVDVVLDEMTDSNVVSDSVDLTPRQRAELKRLKRNSE